MNTQIVQIENGRLSRRKRGYAVTALLGFAVATLCVAMLLFGSTYYSPAIVIKVLSGEKIQGAAFAVGVLRLPRMLSGLFAGFAFGIAGATFQTLLRNPLASPNIIGISSGSSVAAVFCIVVLHVSGFIVSLAAVGAGLLTTALIYILSRGNVFSSGRLILIGIGMQAMLNALVSYLLLNASQYDIPAAMRWLTGSLNGVTMDNIPMLVLSVAICFPAILLLSRHLRILELGDESATTLGVNTGKTRALLIISAVVLIAFATAVTGPIAFVAFLAGPITRRLVGAGVSVEFPAGLTGALLVLGSDMTGQFAFDTRFPVGVITGMLGAPFLLILLFRLNRTGGI